MKLRAPPGTRADYVDFYPLQTRWMDNDAYGHVNNVVAYSLFDTAVNGWLIERGLLDPGSSEEYGVVAESGCRYFAEMSFPDRITAGLRISHLGNSSVRYEVALFRNDDDTAACEGFYVHVYVRRADHKPARIAAVRRAALAHLFSSGKVGDPDA